MARTPQSEMTQLLSDAIALATEAHRHAPNDGFDRAGQPYILHPLRVMLRLKSPAARVVAVLHDVLEDCDDKARASVGVLLKEYPELWDALRGVSKREFGPETYTEFIRRALATSDLARAVKLADLTDNADPTRASDEATVHMIANRYVWASTLLATGDEGLATERKHRALRAWRGHGEHPSKFVLGLESMVPLTLFERGASSPEPVRP